jgi:hypothetical protein
MNKNSSVMLLIGLIDNIGDPLFDGNAAIRQLLSLNLGVLASNA